MATNHAVPSPEFLRGVAANWWHQGADGITLRPQKQEGNWWVSALTPHQTATGHNLITLDLADPGELEQAITLEKVEVHVRYRPRSFIHVR